MIRDHALGLGAIVAAILSLAGALAIVAAQEATGTRPTPTTQYEKNSQRGGGSSMMRTPTGGFSGMASMVARTGMAEDDDPEMNALFQAEASLAGEAAEILSQFADAGIATDRKKLSAELRENLAKQFDVQRQHRELELARVEERVRKLREQIKKRDDARETIIDRRLDLLVNDADGLGWSAPVSSSGRGSTKSSGTGFGPPRGK